jgi:hypothetical protein
MKKTILTIIAIVGAFAVNAQVNYGTNTVTGNNASAIGNNNTASGTESFVGGIDSESLGQYSFVFGDENKAWSRNAIALGKRASIFGAYSVGIGENIQTTSTSAMVIGIGADDDNPLVNSNSRSLMIGYNSDIPTLYVGSSLGVGTIGKVGIGTTSPASLLDVNGTLHVSGLATFDNKITTSQLQITNNAGANKLLISDAGGNASWSPVEDVVPQTPWTQDDENIYILDTKIGIGTSAPSEALTIKGNILCEQIEVIENVPASDFVFEEDYPLMSLQDLETYVSENHHLPEIPSAAEFKENGYNMNEMDDLLLRKVEELTLYALEAGKCIAELKKEVEELKRKNK